MNDFFFCPAERLFITVGTTAQSVLKSTEKEQEVTTTGSDNESCLARFDHGWLEFLAFKEALTLSLE